MKEVASQSWEGKLIFFTTIFTALWIIHLFMVFAEQWELPAFLSAVIPFFRIYNKKQSLPSYILSLFSTFALQ